ncbi:iron chelate uptake ABC transporter family permease subunit [Escherichia coli]
MGDTPRSMTMVVTEWRLPRVLMALSIGAALGVSGAIFQSLMRNPLGSPDVMGLTPGRGAACWWRWCCLVRT